MVLRFVGYFICSFPTEYSMLYLPFCCWSTFSLTLSQSCKLLPFFLHQLIIPLVTSVFLSRHIMHMLLDRQLRDKFASLKYIKDLTFSKSGGNMNWSLFIQAWEYALCVNCAIVGYYAARSTNSLPTFRDNTSVSYSKGMKSWDR